VVDIDPNKLFAYADSFARRHEENRMGTQYPTLARAANRFRCKVGDIENAIECYEGAGYMGVAVGIRTSGGYAVYDKRGQCLVEAYR
jgi:hypothetical protein